MSWFASDAAMVWKLVVKDWQVYQKQLAGFVAGMLLALGLVGMGTPLMASAGALLLLVQLLVVGTYAIQSSIMAERKLQTVPFIMSLPVTPMDVYWGKLLANLVIYLVPLLLVGGGMIALILTTPIADGLIVWIVLSVLFVLTTFCLSLCFAIACESEGWNAFVMLGLMTLIGPFMFVVGRLEGIVEHVRGEQVVWTPTALAVLAAELATIAIAIVVTSVLYARKRSFL